MPKSQRTDNTLEFLQSQAGLKKLTKLAESGKTLEQISVEFGIARNTLYRWSKKHPEIQGAITAGKKVADELVEDSLYEMCFGRQEREVTVEQNNEGHVVKTTIRTRYIPPNVTAIQYWLQNRCNDKWKDRRQLDLNADKALPILFVEDIPNPYEDKDKKGKQKK